MLAATVSRLLPDPLARAPAAASLQSPERVLHRGPRGLTGASLGMGTPSQAVPHAGLQLRAGHHSHNDVKLPKLFCKFEVHFMH